MISDNLRISIPMGQFQNWNSVLVCYKDKTFGWVYITELKCNI